jgi:PadR family transcriptional regulator PadR
MAPRDGILIPGTLDMLVLKALHLGADHGWGISRSIEKLSLGACMVQQGAVYPALQRLLVRGLVTADWRASENNRRVRVYRLTASGRRHLEEEMTSWRRAAGGIERVLRASAREA